MKEPNHGMKLAFIVFFAITLLASHTKQPRYWVGTCCINTKDTHWNVSALFKSESKQDADKQFNKFIHTCSKINTGTILPGSLQVVEIDFEKIAFKSTNYCTTK